MKRIINACVAILYNVKYKINLSFKFVLYCINVMLNSLGLGGDANVKGKSFKEWVNDEEEYQRILKSLNVHPRNFVLSILDNIDWLLMRLWIKDNGEFSLFSYFALSLFLICGILHVIILLP